MAWTKSSKNGYMYAETSAVIASSTNEQSSDTITDELGGKKIICGINVSTAADNVAPDFEVWGSPDGTNWVALKENVSADLTPDVTGVKIFYVDMTSEAAAYYKLVVNVGGAVDLGTSGRYKFFYGVK
jgi:hypothetical protein